MRYERVSDIVRLAIRFQGMGGGLTIRDIQEEFAVSRRTAERMRDAVEAAFGPLEVVDTECADRRIRWRLWSRALNPFISVTPDDLADLEAVAASLDRAGLAERVGGLVVKLRATSRQHSAEEFDAAFEALMEAESSISPEARGGGIASGFGPTGSFTATVHS